MNLFDQTMSDPRELRAIARNLAESVNAGDYSLGEAIDEVLPYEYSVDSNDQAIIATLVAQLIK